ncbi:MAG: hypothetical protein H6713_42480, partial [Myxococcales bacterium]|nr:hypothetical protein [Myxococcales bacterium]
MDSPLDLATLVERLDYFRGAPRRRQPSGAHKEWQHFIVHAPDIHALINFNIIDHAWSERATPRAHVIVLVRALDRAGWDGDVERFHDGAYAVAEGRVDARFGANTLRFCDGRYHLHVRSRDRAIRADIELRPVSIPVLSNNQRLAGGRRISWVFVPRLVASGVIWLDGQRYAIESAPAYHDHNWGEFRWGEDLA